MPAEDGGDNGSGGLRRGVGLSAVVFLVLGTLGISTAFGVMLLLPLYVQELGGNEASFGVILSSAAIPAVLCIGFLIRHPERFRPHAVVAAAITVYAMGTFGAALVDGSWKFLIGIGVLLGTAWAVVYTASPMVMNGMVTDAGRVTYFGYLTGTQQVGIGAGPVIARFLVETPLGFRGAFLCAGVVCLVAAALTILSDISIPDARRSSGQPTLVKGEEHETSLREAIGGFARSEAIFSLVMILLFACLFTSMTQFQTTFADTRDLDYSTFYVAYTGSVIFSRFVLAGMASRFDTRLVIAISVSIMTFAVAAFFTVGTNAFLYGVASATLGLGYGLALPVVQAQAVNVSGDEVRSRILPLAGLLFQAVILGFPLAAGWVIAGLGYQALFAILLTFTIVQVAIGWWRFSAARGGTGPEGAQQT